MIPQLHEKYRIPGTLIGYRVVKVDEMEGVVVLRGPGKSQKRIKMTFDTLEGHYERWADARAVRKT